MEQDAIFSPSRGAQAPQHSPAAVDSVTGTPPDRSRRPALSSCVPHPHGKMAQTRCSTKCVLSPGTPRFGAGCEAQLRPWADLPSDIVRVVAGRIHLLEDRARMRSVCQGWRAAARLCRPPPPPLPLLVFSNFGFSSFCADGGMTGVRRIPLPDGETAADDVRCVGSFEGWLVGVQPMDARFSGDGQCFLMKAFSLDVIHFPPRPPAFCFFDAYCRSLPIINGEGEMHCVVQAGQSVMSFRKVILSSSPDCGTKWIAAAICVDVDMMGVPELSLWRHGMSSSWCGKLYMLSNGSLDLFAFEISEDDSGPIVSRVEHCVMEELPVVNSTYLRTGKILEWHGKLLLVVTYFGGEVWHSIISKVRVFEVDLSTNPVRFTEINTLDGDCIFISPCSSRSFRACQYDGVEDDFIYFIDYRFFPGKYATLNKFVYNMRDGMVAPFPAGISEENLRAPDGRLMNPTWFFPSE
ncbi:hypothetical protein ACP70R_007449 [Stipagrostis hirtigluma subsp. patula]